MEQLKAMRQDSPQRVQHTGPVQRATNSYQPGDTGALFDNRPGASAQRQLIGAIGQSARVARLQAVGQMMNNSARTVAQRTLMAPAAQKKGNGLPEELKSGVESLSGISMDHVQVHYNSPRPAQLNAHAYAQGTDIHLAPGQEQHLPHEAWHIVQQAQNRVRPTMQAAGGIAINDDANLEQEADVMGARVATASAAPAPADVSSPAASNSPIQGQFFEKTGGAYTWHDEDPDNSYHRLPETRRYYGLLNPLNLVYPAYPVYTRAAVDRSGRVVEGGPTPQEIQGLQLIAAAIQGTAYENILGYIEDRILQSLGADVLVQFYRGAHIIFNDNGDVYRGVFERGKPVAKLRPQTWSEWFVGEQVAATPLNLGPAKKGGAGLGARRPERSETSHYIQDALPQLGIDLPGNLSGHILVGLVPNVADQYGSSAGHTFIQTEMYGFKTVYDHYVGHGRGFFWNYVASHQSGLVGYCKYSEKNRTEIREQDNPHRPPVQGKFIHEQGSQPAQLSGPGVIQRAQSGTHQQPVVQRKISFDGGDPELVLPGDATEKVEEMRRTLLSFGDISKSAAEHFTLAMQSEETLAISRNESGEVTVDADETGIDGVIDAKSLFDLYRRRLQLLGLIKGVRRADDDEEKVAIEERTKKAVERSIETEGLTPKEYGEHHGTWYKLGLTSVFNTIVDENVEGFDLESTDFSDFAIQPPQQLGGKAVATGKGGQILADGWYMYIVGKDLAMKYFYTNNYVQEDKADRSKVFSQYIPHTVLSGGAAVWAAGTFLIRDGEFVLVDNGSGHYRPRPGSLNVVKSLLSSLGYRVNRARFLDFEATVKLGGTEEGQKLFPNLKGIDIGLVKKGLFFMNRPERSPEIEEHFKAANKPSVEGELFALGLLLATILAGQEE